MALNFSRDGRWFACLMTHALLVLFLAYVAWRIVVYYPCNHWGADVRWGWALCVPAAAASVWLLWRGRAIAPGLGGTFFACTAAVAIHLLHHHNLLVSYELWIRRGMPGPGQR